MEEKKGLSNASSKDNKDEEAGMNSLYSQELSLSSSDDDVEIGDFSSSDAEMRSPSLSPQPDLDMGQFRDVNNDDDLSDDGAIAQATNERTPSASEDEAQMPLTPAKKKCTSFSRKGIRKPKCLDYPDIASSSNKPQGQRNQKRKASAITTKEKLLALEEKRLKDDEGTWIQCSNEGCRKWRYVHEVKEPTIVPDKWYCKMNPDTKKNTCDAPEDNYKNLDFIHAKFTFGSLVWAKVDGYPWWPAMVEDDPDVQSYFYAYGYSEFPSHYHVVFLDDKVSRAWVRASCILPFTGRESNDLKKGSAITERYRQSINKAKDRAMEAMAMSIAERLKKFGFAKRFEGKFPKYVESSSSDEDASCNQIMREYSPVDALEEEDFDFSFDSLSSLEITPKKKCKAEKNNASSKSEEKQNDDSKTPVKTKVKNISSSKHGRESSTHHSNASSSSKFPDTNEKKSEGVKVKKQKVNNDDEMSKGGSNVTSQNASRIVAGKLKSIPFQSNGNAGLSSKSNVRGVNNDATKAKGLKTKTEKKVSLDAKSDPANMNGSKKVEKKPMKKLFNGVKMLSEPGKMHSGSSVVNQSNDLTKSKSSQGKIKPSFRTPAKITAVSGRQAEGSQNKAECSKPKKEQNWGIEKPLKIDKLANDFEIEVNFSGNGKVKEMEEGSDSDPFDTEE